MQVEAQFKLSRSRLWLLRPTRFRQIGRKKDGTDNVHKPISKNIDRFWQRSYKDSPFLSKDSYLTKHF